MFRFTIRDMLWLALVILMGPFCVFSLWHAGADACRWLNEGWAEFAA